MIFFPGSSISKIILLSYLILSCITQSLILKCHSPIWKCNMVFKKLLYMQIQLAIAGNIWCSSFKVRKRDLWYIGVEDNTPVDHTVRSPRTQEWWSTNERASSIRDVHLLSRQRAAAVRTQSKDVHRLLMTVLRLRWKNKHLCRPTVTSVKCLSE